MDGLRQSGDVRMFWLPGVPRNIRIMSPAGVAQELGIARDPRLLGIALRPVRWVSGTADQADGDGRQGTPTASMRPSRTAGSAILAARRILRRICSPGWLVLVAPNCGSRIRP